MPPSHNVILGHDLRVGGSEKVPGEGTSKRFQVPGQGTSKRFQVPGGGKAKSQEGINLFKFLGGT